MAKLGGFIHVSDIRGKLGGNVFTRVPSGGVLRVRVRPHNPRTSIQSQFRNALTASSRLVHDMSSADYDDWKIYCEGITKVNGISGHSFHPTVINAVNALATIYYLLNGSTLAGFPATPPTTAFSGDDPTVTAASGGASGEIDFTASVANGANINTILLVQHLRSVNGKPSPTGYRIRGVAAFAAMALTSTVSGLVPDGWYSVAYEFAEITTGQTTKPVVLGTFQAHA